jgi:amino acid adenylation domain-containing protein
MALLPLFQLLLSRHTGQEDVSVGCPMTHRFRAEVSRVVGFFANMMVLRSRLDGNPSFHELLRRTREVALGAYAHQDLPFEQLVAELQPERVPGRNPFFQLMLVVEESAWRDLDLLGSQCTPFPVHNGTAKFDLSLYVIDHPKGLHLALEYSSDLFDAETAGLLLEHYENLLRGVVADPDCRVFDLPLLSPAEREHVLLKWNNTREHYPHALCAPRLIEAQVDKTPDAIAARFKDQSLTYSDLNSRANRLAHHLINLGVGAEVPVAICVQRSLDLVIAMLATMKSGGAYLPLDPSHPSKRREAILRNGNAKILITDEAVSKDMDVADGCAIVSLKNDQTNIARQSDANLAITVHPHDLAYVIYTSGSTGYPKGVQAEHRNLTNALLAMRKQPGLLASDVFLATTTVAFDPAGVELWLPLTTGASVILASRDEITDPHRLMDILEKSNVTVMQGTPTNWRMLLAAGWSGNPRLKVLCGGESLSSSLADELVACCGSVWNLYGPTETTIWASVYQVQAGEAAVVPIGRPTVNTTMYVLDRNMHPVPIGVRGELYIGGAGVARGYLGAPQLTAERFVPDPFSTAPDSRLYRTGDLVRQRRDGNIEFFGRNDFQVKVRGFRIEPAEIEAVLAKHPAVSEAVVQAREDTPGDKRLVAYVVAKTQITCPSQQVGSAKLTRLSNYPSATDKHCCLTARYTNDPLGVEVTRDLVSELRSLVKTNLPDYMVPSAFVVLDTLPITPNAKLDWKALPAPEPRAKEIVSIVPRDPIEARLAKIWEQVLGIDRIGVTDNFFRLGGDSLLTTHLFAQIEKEFGRRLPMGTLFEAPTIEALAAILRQSSWLPSSVLQVQAGDPSIPPIFFVQARIGYHVLAAELGLEQPVYVVSYDDLVTSDTERSLRNVAEELAPRIRRQQPQGPYYLAGWCLAGRVALAVARELIRQGERIRLLAVIDTPAPGNARPSRSHVLRSFIDRLQWHMQYVLHNNRQEKIEWITGAFRALGWHSRYRAWQLARLFFLRIGQPLPQPLRDPIWLMVEIAKKEATIRYPGRITLFCSSGKAFTCNDRSDLGWGKIADHGVDVHQISGLHRSVLRSNVRELGRRMKDCLAQAQQSHSTPT